MKRKGLIIATILFFLLVNTTYYWEGKLGILAMLSMLILVIYFIVLTFLFVRQTYFAVKEKFADRQQNYIIGFMTFVLVTSFFFPSGLINFERLEGDNLLVAQREGVANCMTTLKLKDNNKFIQQSVCFGLSEITGVYKVKGDTIFFDKISYGRDTHEFYEYALIKNYKSGAYNYQGCLDLFKNSTDTIGTPMPVIKNDLTNTKNAL